MRFAGYGRRCEGVVSEPRCTPCCHLEDSVPRCPQAVGAEGPPAPGEMREDVVPYFKTEPGLPQTHLEGNRLVLTCLAEGSWPLEFKWLRNDSEVTAYSSEYRYVIPALRTGWARSCREDRRSTSRVHMGSFLAGEQRKTVPEGQAAVLDLPPLRSYPRPQVTWFREGHKIIPSDRM
ncbi:Protein sidekick-1 [Myotis brandtii]|uniref:Protein sidekick-1 n=1 Tax=Myotis brandtii TaxID=109478 RepID=S7NGG8_MYOBR|nr:Protein sidekick-1 [Myotis brandtii]